MGSSAFEVLILPAFCAAGLGIGAGLLFHGLRALIDLVHPRSRKDFVMSPALPKDASAAIFPPATAEFATTDRDAHRGTAPLPRSKRVEFAAVDALTWLSLTQLDEGDVDPRDELTSLGVGRGTRLGVRPFDDARWM